VTSVACLASGIVGMNVDEGSFDATLILIGAMAIIAVFANLTAFARVAHCKKELTK
jgi:CDP-diacylglycerol--glycerol-3-phosphate 3-phosphatidyltransferase